MGEFGVESRPSRIGSMLVMARVEPQWPLAGVRCSLLSALCSLCSALPSPTSAGKAAGGARKGASAMHGGWRAGRGQGGIGCSASALLRRSPSRSAPSLFLTGPALRCFAFWAATALWRPSAVGNRGTGLGLPYLGGGPVGVGNLEQVCFFPCNQTGQDWLPNVSAQAVASHATISLVASASLPSTPAAKGFS